jgi:hypothetical protein
MWHGNTTDVKTLIPVMNQLKTRFIGNICIRRFQVVSPKSDNPME